VTAAIDPRTTKPESATERKRPLAPLQDWRHKLTGNVIIALARFFSGYTVRWVDCQPDTCQRIYFANHTSHLDAVVLWSALPAEIRNLTRPVAAKDYWGKTPWKRFLACSFNAMLIDRKEIKVHQSPVDLMIREIEDIYSLIVFPEGGRAEDGTMGEFKSGIYYLAKKRPILSWFPFTWRISIESCRVESSCRYRYLVALRWEHRSGWKPESPRRNSSIALARRLGR
jgi:1-acyl-sn-glycerol-3-phosphate acyltransferase